MLSTNAFQAFKRDDGVRVEVRSVMVVSLLRGFGRNCHRWVPDTRYKCSHFGKLKTPCNMMNRVKKDCDTVKQQRTSPLHRHKFVYVFEEIDFAWTISSVCLNGRKAGIQDWCSPRSNPSAQTVRAHVYCDPFN